jgi:manganese efflux pump family protein
LLGLLLLAASVGLSNFAGAIGIGVSGTDAGVRWRVGVVFGAFEAGMPIVGLAVGQRLTAGLGDATRWAGAAMLIAVGTYALVDALRGRASDASRRASASGRDSASHSDSHSDSHSEGDGQNARHSEGDRQGDIGPGSDGDCDRGRARSQAGPISQRTTRLLLSGLALSLDNLAVGFALGTLVSGPAGILLSALVIGGVSVAMSLAGLELGARIGSVARHRSELFGAVILITVAAGIGTGVI